jgi:hypothetical protein
LCYYQSAPEIDIREYIDPSGWSPFARWFDALNATAAARVTVALTRWPRAISRMSFGERIVLLLGSSSKRRQGAAIAAAQAAWTACKRRNHAKE